MNDGQPYQISLPKVENLQRLYLCGDPGVALLALDRVKSVLNSIHVEKMDQLRELRMPQAEKYFDRVFVHDNPVLEIWSEAVTSIGQLSSGPLPTLVVTGNPLLSCRAAALVAALVPGRTADIRDNGSGCAP